MFEITDGDAHVVIPQLKADFNARIDTQGEGDAAKIVVDAKGTYAAQPITGRLVGGALLSMRDANNPWPVELNLANGPTRVALDGTLQDPLAFKGANVRLRFSGPDMGLLEPLVGFPVPQTPAYQICRQARSAGVRQHPVYRLRGPPGQFRCRRHDRRAARSRRTSNGKAKPVVTMDLRSKESTWPT